MQKVVVGWKVPHEKDYKASDVIPLNTKKKPQLVSKVATAANENKGERKINNTQSREVTVYRKIKLVHSPSDPLTEDFKRRIEKAVRSSFPVRVALHLREYSAFRNQKLVIELLPSDKITLTEEEQNTKIQTLTKQNVELLKEFEVTDNNVGLPEKLKTLGWQCWMYGRNALIILYDEKSEIKDLFQINSRRMSEPVLDEENDLAFEGCIIDGSGLDKESMIYGVYQDRELSPHTEQYGYSVVELILKEAEAHSFMIENTKEVALSAFLPTILMKVDTSSLSATESNTKVSNILGSIEPGKIVAVPTEVEQADMIDMKPDYAGLVTMIDSLETKIYNAFHVPLFMVKSDEIANRATANKTAKLFLEGIVTDDQQWMEDLLGKQWYDPILRETMKRNTLETTGQIDTSNPTGNDMPLPFIVRRKFEVPTVEDFIDLATSLVELKNNNIWDTTKVNEILGTEEVTSRVEVKEQQDKQMEADKLKFDMNLKQQELNNNLKATNKVATASLRKEYDKSKILKKIEEKLDKI